MNAQQIRNEYLKFFKERGHEIIPRAKLVPQDDPTTLFTGSGMQPLLPFLLGAQHPNGDRLANSQTCLRSQDIEDVGDNRHTTFFEMLGNWSMGDYFKEQQIRWFFEFLTDIVGLDPNKIYVTAFIGDEKHGIPRDDEAANIWQKVFEEKGIEAQIVEVGSQADGDKRGIKPGERIFFYDDGENWWSRGGGLDKTPIGDPCGPDSEVFYDFGPQNHADGYGLAHPASDSGQFMEIGNQVFMQYRRLDDGSFEPLAKKNVDFGGGLERIAAASIDSPDVFKISILLPIIEKLQTISGKKYESHTESMRVIADHLRAATFLAVDGVAPSNKEQGYVMRRLLRRAIRFAFDLGIEQNFLEEIVPVIADIYTEDYPEVKEKRADVIAVLVKEEKVFRQTLRKGLRELEKMKANGLTGNELFTLYDTFGFPVELSTEEAFRQEIKLSSDWRQEFDEKMNEQKQRSKTASQGVFKGGLDGQTEATTRYHTSAHLLGQAMRIVLGESTAQKGCNINEERLRFDFSYPEKVPADKLKQIEDIVNEQIAKDLVVSFNEYPIAEARAMGAYGEFGDKYGEFVKVYRMQAEGEENPFSLEICGGPHVDRTSELSTGGKKFKITKEESSSAGVRRIKAILA
ncbi:alanine--tRNA ligase [Candidatus Saccharibacteria bacterium HGW-Saccharibacteria-1]|jgi:alanyl-tRNA synthetase|nr:MAG: alanine--tRNA ligase [Candidatus Saccharibacteria bacterium HGW-Saccharibacteria-1]